MVDHSAVNRPETIDKLGGDGHLRPVTIFGKVVLVSCELFTDFRTPCCAVVGLDVGKHAGLRIAGGVRTADELAQTVGAEVVGYACGLV